MENLNNAPEWSDLPNDTRPKIRYWIPGAAVDDADLVKELESLKRRGFGGVEVVPLLNTPDEIIRSEDGWGTAHWDHVLRLIHDTLQRLGMTMDVANGPMWPISMPAITDADDPSALTELTYGVIGCGAGGACSGPLPERRVKRGEGTPHLLHVFAYQQYEDGTLMTDSYTDLRGCVIPAQDDFSECPIESLSLHADLPLAEDGCSWLLFAFYVQPAAQKTANGKYYVIDHISRAGVNACAAYWEPVFRAQESFPAMESIFCDSLEYQVSLDWSRDFEQEFEARRGYSILPYLPFIGYKETYPESDAPGYRLDHPEISDGAAQDYLETLTQCYCEYHLKGLSDLAARYGKTIRYQVAYNKPYDEERCPLYVQIPENEALGRPTLDGMKTMAAAAHLGRKERYSFECAAEFGNCYGQDFEDLFWWVKRSLISGMNAQVLHGGSYSGGYHGILSQKGVMKGVEWPGYEAFGKIVSNNWNRTLSETDSKGCMDAIARLNTIFRKRALVDCAVYRASYRNDGLMSEFGYFEDGGALTNAGYSYETISAFLLSHPNTKVGLSANRPVLDPEGASYQCLLIPPQRAVSLPLLERIRELIDAGFPVIWFGEKPLCPQYFKEQLSRTQREAWADALEYIWTNPHLTHAAAITDAVPTLITLDIRPRMAFEGDMDLISAVRQDAASGTTWFAAYGYNRVTYEPQNPNPSEIGVSCMFRHTKSEYSRPGRISRRAVPVRLCTVGQVYLLDPWSGTQVPVPFTEREGGMEGTIFIEEDELILLVVRPEDAASDITSGRHDAAASAPALEIPVKFDTLQLYAFEPGTKGEASFLRSGYTEEAKTYIPDGSKPWCELDPALETFVGQGVYHGTLRLEQKEDEKRYILCLGEVCDTFTLTVNGRQTAFPDQVTKRVDITDQLRPGENELIVTVTSNLFNRLLKDYDVPGFGFTHPYTAKKYGIFESEGKRCVLYVI